MGFPAPADRAKFRGPADRVKFRLANPRDVKALEPVIGPPLANPLREKPACPIRENPPPPARKAPPPPAARKPPPPPARKPPPPPAWKPPPPPCPPNPPPRGSAVPIEMASAKRESVAIEATRKYLGIATSRCRGPVGYRAHSLEPPAAAMVAVPRGKEPATPSAAGSCCLATTLGRQYWNRQLALGLIRRHANCRFQLRSRSWKKERLNVCCYRRLSYALTLPLSYLLLFFAPSGRAMTPSRLPV